jgi:hypothetical protein
MAGWCQGFAWCWWVVHRGRHRAIDVLNGVGLILMECDEYEVEE